MVCLEVAEEYVGHRQDPGALPERGVEVHGHKCPDGQVDGGLQQGVKNPQSGIGKIGIN